MSDKEAATVPDQKQQPTAEDGFAHMRRAIDDLKKARDVFHAVLGLDLDRTEYVNGIAMNVNTIQQIENHMTQLRNEIQNAERLRSQPR